jgi:hypothetical protein
MFYFLDVKEKKKVIDKIKRKRKCLVDYISITKKFDLNATLENNSIKVIFPFKHSRKSRL